MRFGRWKGVRGNVGKNEAAPFELYDLDSDPAESRDVAAAHPEIVRRIAQIAAEAHVPSPMSVLFPSEQARVTPARKTPRK